MHIERTVTECTHFLMKCAYIPKILILREMSLGRKKMAY